MATKSTDTINRLMKKLSAVRATLNNDERALLDQIVLNASVDVAAHSVDNAKTTGKATGKMSRINQAKTSGKSLDATDVVAHNMESAKTSGKASGKLSRINQAKTSGKSLDANDVVAHNMDTAKTTGKLSGKVSGKSMIRIILNDTDGYKVS